MANWRIKGKWIEACNCAVGCPCNTTGFPTHGNCEGAVGLLVTEGDRDGVDLAGVKVAAAVVWPGAIHEGNGKMAVFVDAADDDQRNAIISIITAEDGGMPWEILAATVSEISGPFFETVEFKDDGTETAVRVGDKFDIKLQTLKNPVTGEDHEAHFVLPGGFIWTDGSICTSTAANVGADGVKFDHAGKSGIYADVEWSNAETAEKVAGTKF
ncbi:MAG: DUF1326 domain-containing protein [Tepidisphaeraceae bacterium]